MYYLFIYLYNMYVCMYVCIKNLKFYINNYYILNSTEFERSKCLQ